MSANPLELAKNICPIHLSIFKSKNSGPHFPNLSPKSAFQFWKVMVSHITLQYCEQVLLLPVLNNSCKAKCLPTEDGAAARH
jgi:hypothetical protein